MEKFRRNEQIAFHEDILKRTFDIGDNKIILQFQYGKNDIRPTIRIYTCPPKSDYGCEILFNEEDNPVDEVYLKNYFLSFLQKKILDFITFSHFIHFKTNKYERNVPKIKRYYMLLEQLREQDARIKAFDQRLLHIESTIVEHQNNVEHPILTKSIYDSLRNTASRSRRLAEVKGFAI